MSDKPSLVHMKINGKIGEVHADLQDPVYSFI